MGMVEEEDGFSGDPDDLDNLEVSSWSSLEDNILDVLSKHLFSNNHKNTKKNINVDANDEFKNTDEDLDDVHGNNYNNHDIMSTCPDGIHGVDNSINGEENLKADAGMLIKPEGKGHVKQKEKPCNNEVKGTEQKNDEVVYLGNLFWEQVSTYLPTRSPNDCETRFKKMKKTFAQKRKNKGWTDKEKTKLEELVKVLGKNDWNVISLYIPTKSPDACKTEWERRLKTC